MCKLLVATCHECLNAIFSLGFSRVFKSSTTERSNVQRQHRTLTPRPPPRMQVILPPLGRVQRLPSHSFLAVNVQGVCVIQSQHTTSTSTKNRRNFITSNRIRSNANRLSLTYRFKINNRGLLNANTNINSRINVLSRTRRLRTKLTTKLNITRCVTNATRFRINLNSFNAIRQIIGRFRPLLNQKTKFHAKGGRHPQINTTAPRTTTRLVRLERTMPINVGSSSTTNPLSIRTSFSRHNKRRSQDLTTNGVNRSLNFSIVLITTNRDHGPGTLRLQRFLRPINSFNRHVR